MHHFRHPPGIGRSLEVLLPRTLSRTCSPEEFLGSRGVVSMALIERYAMGAKPIFAMNIARTSEKGPKMPKLALFDGDFFGCNMMDLCYFMLIDLGYLRITLIQHENPHQPVESPKNTRGGCRLRWVSHRIGCHHQYWPGPGFLSDRQTHCVCRCINMDNHVQMIAYQ